MIYLRFIILALVLAGCATPQGQKLQTTLREYPDQKVLDVPFYAQEEYLCGPAALSIVATHLGLNVTSDELVKMLYTPDSKGTFQNDLLSATRRLGLIAVPVFGLRHVIMEINDGRPVLIFQNLGLSWIPKFHYAVITGYDLSKNEIILHTGEFQNYRMSMNTFEHTWARIDHWGLVIVKPGTIPATATEFEMAKATAHLEQLNKLEEAQLSYEKIIERWPTSLVSLVGLGNIHYNKKEYQKAYEYLKSASEAHPESTGARNNYSLASRAWSEEQLKYKKPLKKR